MVNSTAVGIDLATKVAVAHTNDRISWSIDFVVIGEEAAIHVDFS